MIGWSVGVLVLHCPASLRLPLRSLHGALISNQTLWDDSTVQLANGILLSLTSKDGLSRCRAYY
ncbi:hypothetical protein M404DRAFT_1006872 [Pisolithus tinctorius Marx 270]|uniref:Uncharacterized protein n=1 Tax=Pisolithus tinctorius Marx 270 TaxID=870435 RepID=A0A0C3NKT0_PISTI|nr:hypothetical protein M404DRAFT_1006872 [Pisolithus tinctorius Marx 270]